MQMNKWPWQAFFRGRPLELGARATASAASGAQKTMQNTAERRKSCLSRRWVFASWRTVTTTATAAITAHNVNSSSSESESEVLSQGSYSYSLWPTKLRAQKKKKTTTKSGQGGCLLRKTKQHLKVKANGKVCVLRAGEASWQIRAPCETCPHNLGSPQQFSPLQISHSVSEC